MGLYSSYAVRDPYGNLVGYDSSQQGQIRAQSQAYLDTQNQYNQQHYATIGGLTPVYNQQHNMSINPGAFANNALGSAMQVAQAGSKLNTGVSDSVLNGGGSALTGNIANNNALGISRNVNQINAILGTYPTKPSGSVDEGRNANADLWNTANRVIKSRTTVRQPTPQKNPAQSSVQGLDVWGFQVNPPPQQKPAAPANTGVVGYSALGYARGKYKPKINPAASKKKGKGRASQNDNDETELLRELGICVSQKKPGKKPRTGKYSNFWGI